MGYSNALRYRGYYWDEETGFYFLRTRFYDPETCRFINADDVSYLDPQVLNGLNLYAYCNNNPIMNIDPDGTFWGWIIAAVIATVVVAVAFKINNNITHGYVDKDYLDDNGNLKPGVVELNLDEYDEHIYYKIENNDDNINLSVLTIYNSYKFMGKEKRKLLEKLIEKDSRLANINKNIILNEWGWHNFSYALGYKQKDVASVDVYFNAYDDSHDFFSIIMKYVHFFK